MSPEQGLTNLLGDRGKRALYIGGRYDTFNIFLSVCGTLSLVYGLLLEAYRCVTQSKSDRTARVRV